MNTTQLQVRISQNHVFARATTKKNTGNAIIYSLQKISDEIHICASFINISDDGQIIDINNRVRS